MLANELECISQIGYGEHADYNKVATVTYGGYGIFQSNTVPLEKIVHRERPSSPFPLGSPTS